MGRTRKQLQHRDRHPKSFLRDKQEDSEALIIKALYELNKAAGNQSKSLYEVNLDVYNLLRYGIKVAEDTGDHKQTVWLNDWEEPTNNDFAIAEEVTILGQHNKRPDIVIYVNGIDLGVIELKRSKVSVSEGIRQNLDNQKQEFIQPFYNTFQLVMAGNDTQDMRYRVIKTRKVLLGVEGQAGTRRFAKKPSGQASLSNLQQTYLSRIDPRLHCF